MSNAMLIHSGVPRGSKLSPMPTEPVRRIYYADDITVWASGVKISELEQKSKYLFDGDAPVLTGKTRY